VKKTTKEKEKIGSEEENGKRKLLKKKSKRSR
jgi:hypothetical protein